MPSDQSLIVPERILNEGEVPLTKTERALLSRLHRAAGRLVDRTTLLADVFGYHPSAETHTLATHVWRIRQKIETDPGNPRKLISGDGGYLLLIGSADAVLYSHVNGQRWRAIETPAGERGTDDEH